MLNSARKHLGFAAVLVTMAGLAGTASAETTWQKNHPRRTQVNQEERDMAGQNGGHITKSEQKVLNGQENHLSGQIPPK
jgi:hypothetical protein